MQYFWKDTVEFSLEIHHFEIITKKLLNLLVYGRIWENNKIEYLLFATQKWAFYYGKNADFSFSNSVWNDIRFCVVANRSRIFPVCGFGCTSFL